MQRLQWQLVLSCLFLLLWAPFIQSAAADEGVIVLDGLQDADYVSIATDPAGDLASPGPGDWDGVAWTDMTELLVSADATTLYVYIPAPAYSQAVSAGQIVLALEVDGNADSGGAGDPWGNAITFDYNTIDGKESPSVRLPDYLIRGNIVGIEGGNGWTELRTWADNNWDTGAGVNWGGIDGGQIGTNIAYADGAGIEFAIPLADIGAPAPADVRLQFLATQGGGGKGAYDTVPSDDQSTGWDDATEQDVLVSVPLAVDPAGDLASPGPGDWEGVAWTDTTRLHVWTDASNLHLYLPSAAYDETVSTGQIGLAIDTTAGDGGAADAWGNAITFAYDTNYQNLGSTPVSGGSYLPDILIRGNIFGPSDNGWTELRTWNGNWDDGGGVDWGGIGNSGSGSVPGANVEWRDGDGLRLTIPFADVSIAAGDTVNLQFFTTQGGGGKGAYDTVPADDQSDGWDDATTQLVTATYTVPEVSDDAEPPDASHDNNVFWDQLGHDSRDTKYRTPGGPVIPNTPVTLRLRAADGDLTEAKVRIWDDRNNTNMLLPLTLVAADGTYEYWETTVTPTEPTLYWYRFIAIDGTATAYYEDDANRDGGWGQPFGESPDNSYQLTVYDPAYDTPDWVKNGIMYQIFPDRFRNGDPTNDPAPGRFFYNELNGTIYRSDPAGGTSNAWNTVVCDPREDGPCAGTYSLNFYGGDLQGVIDKLDYLQDLGITILYFNPIFESPSNHKYDTADYTKIAKDFGDLNTFINLVNEANNRGMRIVLDGVFNHTSSDSFYFDRYSRYDADGNETSPGPGANDGSGACESNASPFRSWYYFVDVPAPTGPCAADDGTPNGANYESWFGFDSLPKLRAGEQQVRDLIWDSGPDSVARYWMQYADGWRLDVGGDVDPGLTNDPNNDYWEGFRAAVRETNPEAYIVLEEWGNASAWMLGNEMDATMNYQYSSAMLSFWRDTVFVDNDHNESSSAGILAPIAPSELDARLKNWEERYPPQAYQAMMNLLGSHDTNRPLFFLDHNAADANDDSLLQDPNYDWSDAMTRLKGVTILQFTLPGSPTVYYGDEVGLVGPTYFHGGKWEDDPYNRQPFPWLDESGTPFYAHLQTAEGQNELRDHYKLLANTRLAHPALRTGSLDTLVVDDEANTYAFGRMMPDYSDAAVVVANRATEAQAIAVDVAGYLPEGATFEDVLTGATYTVTGGELNVNVAGMYGAVLVVTGGLVPPPAAPADLMVTDVRAGELDLAWSAVAGAEYDVYRSILHGGGYEYVATTSDTTYTDTGLANATPYYYVVMARDLTSGLMSGVSNEATGVPAHDLSTPDVWFAQNWPPTINHTISAITPTEPIFGQLYIPGFTGDSGPAQGISAEIGYAPIGTPPQEDLWQWAAMAYIGPAAFAPSNDEFSTALLPDAVGDYWIVSRWSADGGNSWFYADMDGPADSGIIGGLTNLATMTVVASDDTTAPAPPTALTLDGTTNSTISFSWTASPDGDVAGYEIYRSVAGANMFDRIDTVAAAATSYTDDSVTTGQTYEYYLVAFDTSFNRSAPSEILEATAEPRIVAVVWRLKVPAYTPPGAIFISGDQPEFGPWNPGIAPLTPVGNNIWEYTSNILDGTEIEFKFTRGSWDTVESWGSIVGFGNREMIVEYGTDGTMLIDMTSTDWGSGNDSFKAVQYWRDPIVVGHFPADGQVGVGPNADVIVSWSIPMEPDTDFTVEGPDGPVAGVFSYDSDSWIVTFDPDAPLDPLTTYTVTVADQVSIGVPGGDSGFQQSPQVWSFTTGVDDPVTFPIGYAIQICPDGAPQCFNTQLTIYGDGTYTLDGGDPGVWRYNRVSEAFVMLSDGGACNEAFFGLTPNGGWIRGGGIACLVGDNGYGEDSGTFTARALAPVSADLLASAGPRAALDATMVYQAEICWGAPQVGCGSYATITVDGANASGSDGTAGMWLSNPTVGSFAYLVSNDCQQVHAAASSGAGRARCMDGSGSLATTMWLEQVVLR